jgi:hypothetical protein
VESLNKEPWFGYINRRQVRFVLILPKEEKAAAHTSA